MIPLRDLNPTRSTPWLTWLLVLGNIAVFVYEVSLGDAVAGFVRQYGLVASDMTSQIAKSGFSPERNLLPWVTHMFVHGGWLHLIGNVWFLHLFGDNIEDRLGRGRFLVLYFGGGLLAALTQVVVSPASVTPMVGASGAISAILAAYLLYFPKAPILTLFFIFFIPLPAFLFIGVWFAMQLIYGQGALESGLQDSVAWWAHIGGFVGGLVLAILLKKRA